MSASSNDRDKYYRAGVAIPMARKAVFDERMAQIGIKTVGELVSIVSSAEGVVDALRPVADAYFKSIEANRMIAPKRKELLGQIKLMPTDVLDRMYAEFLAQGQKQ